MFVVTYRPGDRPMLFHSRQRAHAAALCWATEVVNRCNVPAVVEIHEDALGGATLRVHDQASGRQIANWPIVMWPCSPKDSAIDALGELLSP